MARLIERMIKKPLSELLLFGNLTAGSTVNVVRTPEGVKLHPSETGDAAKAPTDAKTPEREGA
jgi:hypothetical protein